MWGDQRSKPRIAFLPVIEYNWKQFVGAALWKCPAFRSYIEILPQNLTKIRQITYWVFI